MLMWPFTSDWVEVIELGLVLAAFIAGARVLFCHKRGCYRLGRFRHGHYKLCHVHHPSVPSDGNVGVEHIEQVSAPGLARAPTPPSGEPTGADN